MKALRLRTVFAFALGAIVAAGATGCMTGDETEAIGNGIAEIQAGQLDSGYPAVGMLFFTTSEGDQICTGTLISQSYVLTAAHCAGTNMVFKTGTTWSNFVDHSVDQQIRHPTLDQAIVHLTAPLGDVPVLKVSEGAPPAVGTVCTGVGFGDYTANGNTTNGTKRSATEQVQFTGVNEITVKAVSGLADGGDSGGPLLCGGLIAAVVKGHDPFAGSWPQRQTELYTPVDAAWIASTIAPVYKDLTLQNGWAPYGTRTASVGMVAGNVQLKGAIATTGTNAVAFTLPTEFRPSKNVYVPVDLCGAARGRLFIQPTGVVTVQPEGAFSTAQCFTSLEGVSFAPSSFGFTPLILQNGWTHAPSGTSSAGVQNIGGSVQFRGAIATTGTNAAAFTLPAALRPATNVYVPVTLCNSKKGRLFIQPSGVVNVGVEGPFSNAQCMTSLDGVSFALGTAGLAPLTLQNGWTGSPAATSPPKIQLLSGVVRFKGAIAQGTGSIAFTLPPAFRPPAAVYLPVDLCQAKKGRLVVQADGTVTVVSIGVFADAQCFTSLDGVSFVLSDFTPISLENRWTTQKFLAVAPAAFSVSGGVVQFKGAMSTSGTDPYAFTLPSGARPPVDVYLPVTLCNGQKGRLIISPTGAAVVGADGSFSNASCMTSLEGVSFALSTSSYTALTLQNGWTNAPYSTRNAAVIDAGGIIRLAGAVAGGADTTLFTLPSAFRPASVVYVPVDLCGGAKGRLIIQTNGRTLVQPDGGTFSIAQCLTSLEGVWFAKSASSFAPLTLANGWVNTSFGTYSAAIASSLGMVRLQGAISSGANGYAFTLPTAYRPANVTYVAADLCTATKGSLTIDTSGNVTIQNGESTFTLTAYCFTSLEGISYALGQ